MCTSALSVTKENRTFSKPISIVIQCFHMAKYPQIQSKQKHLKVFKKKMQFRMSKQKKKVKMTNLHLHKHYIKSGQNVGSC